MNKPRLFTHTVSFQQVAAVLMHTETTRKKLVLLRGNWYKILPGILLFLTATVISEMCFLHFIEIYIKLARMQTMQMCLIHPNELRMEIPTMNTSY